MLAHAWAQGAPMRWVAGDEVYGDAPALRAAIRRHGCWYVVGVAKTTPVWTARPAGLATTAPPAQPVAEGEKGPRTYDWAAARVVESEDQRPGVDAWLLARRSASDPTEIAYYLSWAPAATPLLARARVAATRYTVEQCLAEGKGEAGLDEYEVRQWPSWHRHITLAMLAHAFPAAIRGMSRPKGGPCRPSWPS